MAQSADILVIGGGVIGLTTAYFLARDGKKVEVLDKGDLGAEASWAGAGIIPPGNPERAGAGYDKLRATSSRMFPEFTRELRTLTGIDNGYRICGGLEFLDERDEDSLRAWRSEGVEHEALTPQRLSALEPSLGAPPPRGYYLPGMAQVRNPWHMRMLIAACTKLGVQLLPHTPIERLENRGAAVLGVRLSTGELRSAERYLLAAGAWSQSLLEPLGVPSGIHPVRGQIVLLKTSPKLLRHIVFVGKDYLVPREDGHVLIGSTEEPEAGFEKRTTASAISKLIALGTALVPELAQAEVAKCWAGLRPGSLDHLPSLGGVPGCRNLFLAGGHYRAGIQLSLATGMVMSELLRGGAPSIPLDDFHPGRQPGPPFRTAFRT
jgi:glycine oxidase